MNKFCFFLLLMATCYTSTAQFDRYLVQFKDKNNSAFSIANPGVYLSIRAIERRNKYQIAIDSADLPVSNAYIDSVRLSGAVTILNISKWLNQVSIETTDPSALAHIQQLPFVLSTQPIAARNRIRQIQKNTIETINPNDFIHANAEKTTEDILNYGASSGQVKIHQANFLHNHGFRGENMQMAVMDAGFFRYNTLPTFDSLRTNNQILGTWDFVSNETSVAEDDSHGMHCLSTIGANMPGVFVGTAPKTAFYLFRSEDVGSEYPIEEHNFAAAAEKADSLGVYICSVSLGYSSFDDPAFDYQYSDMNGNTSISAKAADVAAKKGMLMVLAAGNEGSRSWHYIITPADADSCLAVGAVDTAGNVAGFSSYGPSSDGQIKPSVAAVGRNAVVANSNTGLPNFGNGTSYACPNMAGVTTCLWQAFPEVNNMEIIHALEASATRYNNPDDRVGYGIPDAKKAFVMLQKKLASHQIDLNNCVAHIQLAFKSDPSMQLEVERKMPNTQQYTSMAILQNNESYGTHSFDFNDTIRGLAYGQVGYRYKISIGADTSYYLDSAFVNYLNSCEIIQPNQDSCRIAPNPVKNNLLIYFNRSKDTKVNLIMQNTVGQKVFVQSFIQYAGTSTKSFDVTHLTKGTYFIQLYFDDKKTISNKIIKQ